MAPELHGLRPPVPEINRSRVEFPEKAWSALEGVNSRSNHLVRANPTFRNMRSRANGSTSNTHSGVQVSLSGTFIAKPRICFCTCPSRS